MLIIFDVEGVLLDGEFLPLLAKLVGKEGEIMDITMRGIRGEIPWEEGLLRRIDALRGIEYNEAMKVALSIPIMKGAKQTCVKLKRAGWRLLAVSGGFTIITDRLREELELDHVVSNELIFKNGKLNGVDISVNSDKANAVAHMVRQLNEKVSDIVTVVDGANDLKLFNIAGLKVAFNAQELVKEKADFVIEEKDLTYLIPVLEGHYGKVFAKSPN